MNVRKLAPPSLQSGGRRLAIRLGERTADRRRMPDFLVIGGQRCGTTSLFRALMAHPQISRANLHKGVNYFDLNYHRGERWYRAHFPMRAADEDTRVFDASGYYMFHPLAADRIARDLPGVKVIAMLRSPVERAFSAYKHERARGFEWERSFAKALELEDRRLAGEVDNIRSRPGYYSFNHQHHAYRRRGEYARLLTPFLQGLGSENVLIVESERFFAEPEKDYARITDFLGVSPVLPASFDRYNARPSADMDPDVRTALAAAFEGPDKELADLLGHDPVWREGSRGDHV
jgi:hypothetical protein